MYFTREPIVETVITSKEGFKLVLRNSKGGGQEEYFVDAVEVISFGKNCFYRSLEKPKSFILPISDYEIVEVRETKMVLKTPSVERGIKIGGGREGTLRPVIKEEPEEKSEEKSAPVEAATSQEESHKGDKKRERRRFRRRKDRDEEPTNGTNPSEEVPMQAREEKVSLIPPPTTLISETISRYKDLPGFSGAFFEREEKNGTLASEENFREEKTASFSPDENFQEVKVPQEVPQESFAENENDGI